MSVNWDFLVTTKGNTEGDLTKLLIIHHSGTYRWHFHYC